MQTLIKDAPDAVVHAIHRLPERVLQEPQLKARAGELVAASSRGGSGLGAALRIRPDRGREDVDSFLTFARGSRGAA